MMFVKGLVGTGYGTPAERLYGDSFTPQTQQQQQQQQQKKKKNDPLNPYRTEPLMSQKQSKVDPGLWFLWRIGAWPLGHSRAFVLSLGLRLKSRSLGFRVFFPSRKPWLGFRV